MSHYIMFIQIMQPKNTEWLVEWNVIKITGFIFQEKWLSVTKDVEHG